MLTISLPLHKASHLLAILQEVYDASNEERPVTLNREEITTILDLKSTLEKVA